VDAKRAPAPEPVVGRPPCTGEVSPEHPSRQPIAWVRNSPFLLLHLLPLGIFFVGFSWVAVAVAVFLYAIRMFAITGFYHRYFSHKTFKAGRPVQFFLGFWGATSVQRGPLWWAAHHRYHHAHSDHPDDLHSPREHGFWRSHMGWFLTETSEPTSRRWIPDLVRFPELLWLDRFHWIPGLLLALTVTAAGAVLERVAPQLGTSAAQMFIWGFCVSTVALYHGTYTINSLSHQFGSQRFHTGDDSRNNFWLALVTLGEGWHNNHHHFPGTARQGFYWWEIDLTYYGLVVMSRLGIISDLKPVPARVLERNRIKR
jgi:stearoyl-CoA desaturase (delta-9 desaturase)